MKRLLFVATLVLVAATAPAFAVDLNIGGIPISIGQPGFYGTINLNGYPQPQLINQQPVIIDQGVVNSQLMYLRVPPDQVQAWRIYCRTYNACGHRVYFVKDSWYEHEYVPRYQKQRSDGRNNDHRSAQYQWQKADDNNRKQWRKAYGNKHKQGNNGNGNKHNRGNKGNGNKHKQEK